MKLVSACLLGVNCTFEGKNRLQPQLLEEFKKGELFPICPEILGGLSIPRIPAEIQGGTGLDVIEGKAYVVNMQGIDVTDEFMKGAYETLKNCSYNWCKRSLACREKSVLWQRQNIRRCIYRALQIR